MIVNVIPVANSATEISKKNQPADTSVDFSAELDKKIAPEAKPAESAAAASVPPIHDKTSKVAGAEAEDETQKDDEVDGNAMIILPGDVSLADIVEKIAPVTEGDDVPFIAPQIQQLQQLVAQVEQKQSQAAVAAPQASSDESVPSEAAEVLPLSDVMALPKEQKAVTVPSAFLPQHGMAKTLAQAALSGMERNEQSATQTGQNALSGELLLLSDDAASGIKAGVNTAGKPQVESLLSMPASSRLSDAPDISARPHFPVTDAVAALQSSSVTAASSSAMLNQPLGTPAWQQALSHQLSYFSRNGIHNAELRLHPEELGSLQINMRLNNDRAQLYFVTENHQVRAALEAAMPHLRTSLAESGINLGQSSVGDDASSWKAFSHSDGSQQGGQQDRSGNDDTSINAEENNPVITKTITYTNGINTFI